MSLKKKLLLIFTCLSALVGIVGFLAISSMKDITNDLKQLTESSFLEVEASTEMAIEFITIDDLLTQYIQSASMNNSAKAALIKQKLEVCFTNFEKALELRRGITTIGLELYEDDDLEGEEEELNELKSLEDKFKASKNEILKIVGACEKGSIPDQHTYETQWEKRNSVLIEELKNYKHEAQDEIVVENGQVLSESKNSTNLMLLISCISLVVAVFAGILFTKSIVTPILKLKAAAQHIALGNMEISVDVKARDEMGDLASAFNKMTQDLKKSRKEIQTYNKNLEQKVNERTRELEENILRLKQTDEKLKDYAESLKKSNLELEQFAYVASHDLQEPLRTTSSFVELLQKQYQGKIDGTADKYLSFITDASERMRVFITDLLEYSRIGRMRELKQVNTKEILNDVMADLDASIKETGTEIKVGSLPVICGYPNEMKQLFQNLILNSIKFRKKETTAFIEIAASQQHGTWQFEFTDNGIGIAREHHDRIFVIFQRLHTRSEYSGSGIGLSHCKKIVELHKGRIWLESEPGIGSKFCFSIPQKTISDETKIKLRVGH